MPPFSDWGRALITAQGTWTGLRGRLDFDQHLGSEILFELSLFGGVKSSPGILSNSTAVAYTNQQGDTRSQVDQKTDLILCWAKSNVSALSATHIPGVED